MNIGKASVLTDIEMKLDAEEIVLALYQGKKAPNIMIEETDKIISQTKHLIHPRAVFEWLQVKGVVGEQVLLSWGSGGKETALKLGPHADLMSKAEVALISVATIGEKIDNQIDELNKSGKFLEVYLLNSVGVIALAEVEKTIRRYVEEQAAFHGWGVGALLAPGSLQGWPIEGQLELCPLLPLEKIGVSLRESGLLIPFKSASGLIGAGQYYKTRTVGSVCHLCMRAETCWRRRN